MSPLVASLNTILALGSIALQVAIVVLAIAYWRKDQQELTRLVVRNALLLTFVVSLSGAVFTLLYSDVFGFVPCGLCWFERIMLYPIVIISGLALWKHEGARMADYILALAIPGALISLYHHYIQMGGSELVKCPAANADCAKRIIFEFGYITFPFLAFVLFVFLIVLMCYARRAD